MTPSNRTRQDWLKRKINAAKAEKGMNWSQIADAWSDDARPVSASSLMSKHSRASFTAVELVLLLQILEVTVLEVPRLRSEGAARPTSATKSAHPGRMSRQHKAHSAT
jgi:hypothetical protein